MFALRDFGASSKEAVLALAEGFGDASALFRYVLLLSLLSSVLFPLSLDLSSQTTVHFSFPLD